MSVAEAVYERTCHVCDAVKMSFMRFYYNVQRARQIGANQKIYQEIRRFDREADYHLGKMNERTNQEYDSKIKNLSKKTNWGWEDNGED